MASVSGPWLLRQGGMAYRAEGAHSHAVQRDLGMLHGMVVECQCGTSNGGGRGTAFQEGPHVIQHVRCGDASLGRVGGWDVACHVVSAGGMLVVQHGMHPRQGNWPVWYVARGPVPASHSEVGRPCSRTMKANLFGRCVIN